MTEYYNKHYISLDANNLIIGGFSDVFRKPADGDICINDKGGYQFRLLIDGEPTEENPLLFFDSMSRIPLYAYRENKVVRRGEKELEADCEAARIEAERIAALPTAQDDINAMLIDHELRIMDLELGISEEGV